MASHGSLLRLHSARTKRPSSQNVGVGGNYPPTSVCILRGYLAKF